MEVHFTPEQEAKLAQIAATAGSNAEQLVKDTVLLLLPTESVARVPGPALPVWDLGVIGSLHRRDMYDDAR